MKKKYKALMLDLDGTTFPNRLHAGPSQNVIKAIAKASKILHVGVATSRPLFMATPVIKQLSLSSFCIVDGGGIILDPTANKVIWEQPLKKVDILATASVAEQLGYPVIYSEGHSQKKFDKDRIPRKVLGIFFEDLSHKEARRVEKLLAHIPTISLHKVVSEIPGRVHIKVRHAIATKQHGILTVSELLKVNTHDFIGVGEGYNDFPLLMACGLKVAMGNAVPELKEIADYIAPSVDEDGVVDVIEKFVLHDK